MKSKAPAKDKSNLRRVSQVPTLRQLVQQITPENRYGEISTGAETGKEIIEW